MTKTQHYSLPQWEAEDPIHRADFNQAMEDIDEALSTAQTAAESVQDAYTPANKPYVVGSYTGDGTATRSFNLGFQPSFVIVSGLQATLSKENEENTRFAMAGAGVNYLQLKLTATGFNVLIWSSTSTYYPKLNATGVPYCYIAFR